MMTKTSKTVKKGTGEPTNPGNEIGEIGNAAGQAEIMSTEPGDEIDRLGTMTVGQLQALFAEVTGKPTRILGPPGKSGQAGKVANPLC